MRVLSDLWGTLQNAFRVNRATLDASALTANRTFTLPDAGGQLALAGGGTLATATLTVSPAQYGQASVNVVNASATTLLSVIGMLVPNADWDADDLGDFEITATANAGSIEFCINRPGPIVGDFKVAYQLG